MAAAAATTEEAEAEGGVTADKLVLEGGGADTTDMDSGADAGAAGEAGVGAGVDNDGNVEVDGLPGAALGGFPSFFFVIDWCGGVLEVNEQ